VRAAIPDAVEVILDNPGQPRPSVEPRHSLQPVDAFHRYLTDRSANDPQVEALFAELLEEALT
jgi:hypothetical protein